MVWCGLGDQTPGLVRILRMMPCQPNSDSNDSATDGKVTLGGWGVPVSESS